MGASTHILLQEMDLGTMILQLSSQNIIRFLRLLEILLTSFRAACFDSKYFHVLTSSHTLSSIGRIRLCLLMYHNMDVINN